MKRLLLIIMAAMLTHGIVSAQGSVLTDLIKNPSFELAGGNGWLTDPQYNGGKITDWHCGNSNNYIAEAWEHNFDIYQEIDGLANGLYEVSVQAFYRTASNAQAYNAYKNKTGEEKVLTEVYCNDLAAPVKNNMAVPFESNLANNCWESYDGFFFLNGAASATEAFKFEDESRNFTQRVYGVVTDGKLRLGIRNTTGTLNGRWTMFDNFQLIYRDKDETALTSVIGDYISLAEALWSNKWYVPDVFYKTLQDVKDAEDGDTKYDALIQLVDAYHKSFSFIEAITRLDEALDPNNLYAPAYEGAYMFRLELHDERYSNFLSVDEAMAAIEEIDMWASTLRDQAVKIESVAITGQKKVFFSLDGKCLPNFQRGINLVRSADGTTRKVLIK